MEVQLPEKLGRGRSQTQRMLGVVRGGDLDQVRSFRIQAVRIRIEEEGE